MTSVSTDLAVAIEESPNSSIVMIGPATSKFQIANPSMPPQDSIELAIFLADTQKQFARFSEGSNVVGGDLDVATATKHEGFKWIKRKYYYDRGLNPLPQETDHV